MFGKEQIEEYLIYNDYIKAAHYLKPDGVHGINHTKRVLIFCIFLAYLNGIDNQLKHVLYLSAVYHDIGRSIDGTDFLHGEASFNKIEKLGLLKNVSHEQKDYIQYIICNHSIEDSDRLYNGQYRQRDNLLNIFKDADALDRIRLHDFNINYLRNEHSHELTRSAWEVQNMDVDVYVKKHKYS